MNGFDSVGAVTETLFMWSMKNASLTEAVVDLCDEYQKRYNLRPNRIFINAALHDYFMEEVRKPRGFVSVKDLPIPWQDIVWFYCTTLQGMALPHAEIAVVAHYDRTDVSCTL